MVAVGVLYAISVGVTMAWLTSANMLYPGVLLGTIENFLPYVGELLPTIATLDGGPPRPIRMWWNEMLVLVLTTLLVAYWIGRGLRVRNQTSTGSSQSDQC